MNTIPAVEAIVCNARNGTLEFVISKAVDKRKMVGAKENSLLLCEDVINREDVPMAKNRKPKDDTGKNIKLNAAKSHILSAAIIFQTDLNNPAKKTIIDPADRNAYEILLIVVRRSSNKIIPVNKNRITGIISISAIPTL